MRIFIGVFVVLFVVACESLRHNGENVCSRVDEKTEKYFVTVNKRVLVKEKVRCWDRRQNFMCDRKIYKIRPIQEERARIVHVPVYFCCPGCEKMGDSCIRIVSETNHWTVSASGCQCYFNPYRFDCPCCVHGGCQCDDVYPDKCVQCGYGDMCNSVYDERNREGVDAWTISETGCACDGSRGTGDCPCCQNRGCQCKEGARTRCRQCGLPQSCYHDLKHFQFDEL